MIAAVAATILVAAAMTLAVMIPVAATAAAVTVAVVETKVIHIKDAPKGWRNNPNYVYIGRGKSGIWGNIWIMESEDERQTVVDKYRETFYKFLELPEFKRRTDEIKGKTLVCFCKPKACHGDVIAEYLNNLPLQ